MTDRFDQVTIFLISVNAFEVNFFLENMNTLLECDGYGKVVYWLASNDVCQGDDVTGFYK